MQINVGYDGSTPSAEAVMWAADEAAAVGARVRIVSCYDIPLVGDATSGWNATEAISALLEAVEQQLSEIGRAVSDHHPRLDVTTAASAGPASSVLVASVGPDDLVVVGASSRQGAAAFWLGSTPRLVIRHSPCPVVVVRGPASRGHPDRIVVGVDASVPSERALRWAADEADRHRVALTLVHGWSYPYATLDTRSAQARDLTRIDAASVLEQHVDAARQRCAVEVTGVLVESSPVTALLDTVRDGDWLVIGSPRRRPLFAGLLGSTVNNVLEGSVVPVIVVPDTEEPA